MQHAGDLHQTRAQRATRRIALFLMAPLLLAMSLPMAFHIARGADFGFAVVHMRAINIDARGPAARGGMLANDRIVSVGGRPVQRMSEYFAAVSGHYQLQPLQLELERGGNIVAITLTPVAPAQRVLISEYTQWIAGLAFLLIGWWVLSRRSDPVARNFFALCLTFAFFLIDIPDIDNLPYMTIKYLLRTLLQLLLPAYVLRFFLQFPQPRLNVTGGQTHQFRLLTPAWLLFALSAFYEHIGTSSPGGRVETILEAVSLVYMLAYFLVGLVLFARRSLRRDRPIQRTKMIVILVGLTAGLVPFIVTLALGALSPESGLPHLQYLGLSLLLVPASFALAIMRYGALDASYVVRVGLIYGSLTALVIAGYLVITVALGNFLSSHFAVDSSQVLVLLVAVTALVIAPLRHRVQHVIDLAFYPARRASRQAMAALADRLTGLIDADAVMQLLSQSLRDLFRPNTFAIVLAAPPPDRDFVIQHSVPELPLADGSLARRLPWGCGPAVILNRLRRPVFCEEVEMQMGTSGTEDPSWAILAELQTSLLVPLISSNRLVGFLAFGPKTGGHLYSQEDLENLHALAVQAGSVIESRQLGAERLRRKRMETELAVARGIQVNILPEAPLETPWLSIMGRNEPCRTVGGDYYDYFQLDDGSVALAIGDVAGKGIPAALMMSSLRVAFRMSAEKGAAPRDVVSRMNAVVASLVGPSNFICFFFALWNPDDGLLQYCNAGMDPPLLLRADKSNNQFLRKGGPVLGVDAEFGYRQGSILLNPGDRLFLYTDGLTEQCDPRGEYFDVARLVTLLEEHAEAAPIAVLDKVFATVREFGDQVRSDDQTAIILQIHALRDPAVNRP